MPVWQVLHAVQCEPGGYAPLASLSRLAALQLQEAYHLPGCLSQLTSLTELCLRKASNVMTAAAARAAVDGALRHLTRVSVHSRQAGGLVCWVRGRFVQFAFAKALLVTAPLPTFPFWGMTGRHLATFRFCCLQLTSLCIVAAPAHCYPLPALAALSSLQRCCLGGSHAFVADQQLPSVGLPLGSWLAGLRELGACLDVLQHSVAALSAATQLTRLAVLGGSFKGAAQDDFWEWASEHPPLQQLQIDLQWEDDLVPCAAVHNVCLLARQRPALDVITVPAEDGDTFDADFAMFVF